MFFKQKYNLEKVDMINDEVIILLRDLETNEYIELPQSALQNKTSKTDLVIYKLVMNYLYNGLLEDSTKIK